MKTYTTIALCLIALSCSAHSNQGYTSSRSSVELPKTLELVGMDLGVYSISEKDVARALTGKFDHKKLLFKVKGKDIPVQIEPMMLYIPRKHPALLLKKSDAKAGSFLTVDIVGCVNHEQCNPVTNPLQRIIINGQEYYNITYDYVFLIKE